ncbi:bile acid:sodium symporter [Pontiella sulfatireligans]|uniref:Arsenical-resistance protein Acr3 n=1 Tax=Pontiella sulfatireligans TaxID=2750658 RepID=A0A6C2UQ87_9BACT|nr:bile acid:sodium symporter [Pontiella sulfatireligans]VGO22378.1 Arsenical-resistance protein Acr3 [Pontiella sulfatireligans]
MLTLLRNIQKRLIIAIPAIMLLGFAAGLLWNPAPLKQWIVPLTFLMVYPMMVNLQLKKVIEGGDGKVQLVTQLLNFTIIPLFAFLLGKWAFPDSPYIALGLLLASLLPTSGMTISWTGMANGNMAAAVKMTVFGLIIGSILTPIYIKGLMGTVIEIPMAKIFKQIMVVVVLPLVLGNLTQRFLIARYGMAHYQKDLKPVFPPFSTLGVLGIVFVAMALKAQSIASNPGQLATLIGPLLALYGLNFLISTFVGKYFFNRADGIALVYGTVMRNLSIALAIAMTAFGKEGADIALIIALAYIIQVQAAAWYVKFTDRIFGPAPETTVRDLMLEGVFSLHLSDSLNRALKLLAEEHIHSFVVLDDHEKAIGMLSTAHVLDALAAETPQETPLSDLTLEPVLFASAKSPLKEALTNMKRSHEYKVIVLNEQNAPSYVLTQEEIIRHMAKK